MLLLLLLLLKGVRPAAMEPGDEVRCCVCCIGAS